MDRRILEKTIRRLDDKQAFNKCIEARVCPECGEELSISQFDWGLGYTNKYSCHCGFYYEEDVC